MEGEEVRGKRPHKPGAVTYLESTLIDATRASLKPRTAFMDTMLVISLSEDKDKKGYPLIKEIQVYCLAIRFALWQSTRYSNSQLQSTAFKAS